MKFKDFKLRVEAAGLKAKECTEYQWQVVGGALLVNYYPTPRSGPKIYIQGTTQAFSGSLEDAIKSANAIGARIEKQARKNQSHYKRHKMRLFKRWNCCHWCKKMIQDPNEASIDHKIPLSLGGLNHHNNYVLACKPCNHEKDNKIW